ncbi:LEVG family PEP-CTERM protein [Limnofasciculus baicalensis]|nr:LEVG family PEP-CTERM protein [Limnofasciculus baicalensis]
MSTFLRNTGAVAALVTTSALATGFLAPSASAYTSLVPQTETEIYVGKDPVTGVDLPCLDATRCLKDLTPYWIESIVSLEDSSSKTRSRLFVDNKITENTYGTYGTNPFVYFNQEDEGTRPDGYWFRPSEVQTNGQGEEQGRLEVGTFTFTFTHIIPELKIAYFDNETGGVTGILPANFIPAGNDGNIQYQTLFNVKTVTLKLGNDTLSGNGDGVSFQLSKKAVPEPGAAVGLGALGLMGIFGLRKRNNKSV